MFRGSATSVTEDKQAVPPKRGDACDKPIKEKFCNCHIPDDDVSGGTQCLPVPASKGAEANPELKRLALFHYATKSREDFELKMKRGGGNSSGNAKGPDFFELVMECVPIQPFHFATLNAVSAVLRPSSCKTGHTSTRFTCQREHTGECLSCRTVQRNWEFCNNQGQCGMLQLTKL